MGVTLSVKLRIRRQYWVTETISNEQRLEDVLARRGEWPLQQFMLIPYAWRFIAFNRQVASEPPATARRLLSRAYSLYDQLTLELLSHQLLARVLLRSSASGKPSHIVELFYRHLAPRLVVGPRTTTTAARGLTLHSRRHASTRHVEMELFVREEDLDDTVRLLKAIVGWAADSRTEFPSDLWPDIERAGLGDELAGLRGSYMHHYAFIFRRVLADETLISMTSGGARYAIGVFTYLREEERGSYYAFCRFLARACVRLLGARLHWGKYVPLSFDEIQRLYLGFSAFHAQCSLVDPHGTFANEYAREVLGLPSLKGRA